MVGPLGIQLLQHQGGRLKVWQEPAEVRKYVIGIDVAENRVRDRNLTRGRTSILLDRPDFSCAIVIDLENADHVATWHGYMDTSEFAITCASIGMYYNDALLVPEVNGPGVALIETLVKVIQYQNIYRSKLFNRVDLDPLGTEFGWRTTATTRPILISHISQAINYGHARTKDAELVKELRQVEYDEQGVARARGRNKDDRVMAYGLALVGRSELMSGSLLAVDNTKAESRLCPDDQITWRRVRAFQERIRDAKRRTSPVSLGVRTLPRGFSS